MGFRKLPRNLQRSERACLLACIGRAYSAAHVSNVAYEPNCKLPRFVVRSLFIHCASVYNAELARPTGWPAGRPAWSGCVIHELCLTSELPGSALCILACLRAMQTASHPTPERSSDRIAHRVRGYPRLRTPSSMLIKLKLQSNPVI